MAAIADSNLRHVRKTIAFDGSANNGNLGDEVTVFTTTGRVQIEGLAIFCSDSLVCAAGGNTSLKPFLNGVSWGAAEFFVTAATIGTWADDNTIGFKDAYGIAMPGRVPVATGGDVTLSVFDAGAGADITDGTIIIDCWYLPITADGALAGDDIDSGYIPVDVKAISGDTTAADRLEALQDGIVLGIVGASSTTTSIANCTGFTEATNDHFNGRLITFLSGNLAGQQCAITDYAGAAQTFTCAALTEAPAASDTFVIH